MIDIYTDGSCITNPGPGGWAAVILENGAKRELHGREESTTNNRMEMLAVVEGLSALPESSEVTVYSDSQYVVNTMTRNWKRNVNNDLWTLLDTEVAKRNVHWQWVRGHDGNPMNELADRLANREANGLAMEADSTSNQLTHIDESGKASMVDVGWKDDTQRVAIARGAIVMKPETLALIESNGFEKGDVIGVARVAGIMVQGCGPGDEDRGYPACTKKRRKERRHHFGRDLTLQYLTLGKLQECLASKSSHSHLVMVQSR